MNITTRAAIAALATSGALLAAAGTAAAGTYTPRDDSTLLCPDQDAGGDPAIDLCVDLDLGDESSDDGDDVLEDLLFG